MEKTEIKKKKCSERILGEMARVLLVLTERIDIMWLLPISKDVEKLQKKKKINNGKINLKNIKSMGERNTHADKQRQQQYHSFFIMHTIPWNHTRPTLQSDDDSYCRILDVKVKAQIIFDNPTGAKLVVGVPQYLKLYKLIEPKAWKTIHILPTFSREKAYKVHQVHSETNCWEVYLSVEGEMRKRDL